MVREGSVLSMGVFIGASTGSWTATPGRVFTGEVPAFAVVVPGTHAGPGAARDGSAGPSLYPP